MYMYVCRCSVWYCDSTANFLFGGWLTFLAVNHNHHGLITEYKVAACIVCNIHIVHINLTSAIWEIIVGTVEGQYSPQFLSV